MNYFVDNLIFIDYFQSKAESLATEIYWGRQFSRKDTGRCKYCLGGMVQKIIKLIIKFIAITLM